MVYQAPTIFSVLNARLRRCAHMLNKAQKTMKRAVAYGGEGGTIEEGGTEGGQEAGWGGGGGGGGGESSGRGGSGGDGGKKARTRLTPGGKKAVHSHSSSSEEDEGGKGRGGGGGTGRRGKRGGIWCRVGQEGVVMECHKGREGRGVQGKY